MSGLIIQYNNCIETIENLETIWVFLKQTVHTILSVENVLLQVNLIAYSFLDTVSGRRYVA